MPLLDQLGPASERVGELDSGEQVEVLARRPRWAHVRTVRGKAGWVPSRFLTSPLLHDRASSLAAQAEPLPPQGKALLRRDANLQLEPRRDSDSFYRLREAEEVEVLAHRVTARAPSPGSPLSKAPAEEEPDTEPSAALQVHGHEDWFLVRAAGEKVGWVLENLLDMNLPVEIARYREGLRIRAWFVLYREVQDGIEHPWYLWATIRPVAGLPFDFDEIRVFVWNPARSRYETSYRERNLIGFYPIHTGVRETASGPAPSFALQVEDETGKRFQKNYVMAGRMVRRVP